MWWEWQWINKYVYIPVSEKMKVLRILLPLGLSGGGAA